MSEDVIFCVFAVLSEPRTDDSDLTLLVCVLLNCRKCFVCCFSSFPFSVSPATVLSNPQ